MYYVTLKTKIWQPSCESCYVLNVIDVKMGSKSTKLSTDRFTIIIATTEIVAILEKD